MLAFKKVLEQNEVIDTFDRYVFESVVDKVIVGGVDEEGNKDPAMITFVYKTGLSNSLDGEKFKPARRNAKKKKQKHLMNCVHIQSTRIINCVHIVVTTHVECCALLKKI